MKNYFGYIRVSTLKQGEKGVSLQEQKAAIESYALRNELKVTNWFEEKETAAKRGRPVFDKMLKLLRKGKAQGVIIHKIDRSARNLKDWADLGELIDKGIEVRFANESLDLNSRGGRLSADIQAVVAADFIRNLKEETRKGFYGRIKQGLYPLPAPVGYLDMGQGKAKEPDPAKAPLVRKTFELYGTGKFTLESLADEIYTLGLRNRRGGRISKNGLSTMLNNPFYAGLIYLKSTGETFPGSHIPIVNQNLFNRVQAILNGKCNSKIQRHDFIFRRMFTCKVCGSSLVGETQKGFIYYRCHNKCNPTTCVNENVIRDKVDNSFLLTSLNEKEILYLWQRFEELKENSRQDTREQKKALELNIENLRARLDRLTDAFIDRLIEKQDFESRKLSLLLEKKGIEEEIKKIDLGINAKVERMEYFLEQIKRLYLGYEMGLPERKREFLEIATSNRIAEGKNVQFELKIPFNYLAERPKDTCSTPYRDRLRTDLDKLFKKLLGYFKSQSANINDNL
ncbi:MAG: recombinase family protein [Desulfobacteraceae bacterium]|nr:recombinase family protein [Desulfobacteraceae bacterium]